MTTPSTEQQNVIDATLQQSASCIVSASPGSGKSTMALQLITQAPNTTKIMLLSYNRALVDETKRRIKRMRDAAAPVIAPDDDDMVVNDAESVFVFTYHGLLTSLLGQTISDDLLFVTHLGRLMSADTESVALPPCEFADIDVLIIDEAQDMRPHFYQLLQFFMLYIAVKRATLQLVVVGDAWQTLYDFYGESRADSRYLSHSDILFNNVNDNKWQHHTLSTTFRCSKNITKFANRFTAEHGRTMISSSSDAAPSHPVQVFALDIYKDTATVVLDVIQESGLDYDDIMVLTSSLNARSPAVPVVDLLIQSGIPVHVNRSGALTESCSSLVTKNIGHGKVKFRTFCSAKGLESKLVIVLFTRNVFNSDRIEYASYVALTRASERLVVCFNRTHTSMFDLEQLLDGFDESEISVTVKRKLNKTPKIEDVATKKRKEDARKVPSSIAADSLFAFIDVYNLAKLVTMINMTTIREPLDADEDYKEEEHQQQDGSLDAQADAAEKKEFESLYVQKMLISVNGDQHVNVMNIAGKTLLFALEYATTGKTPTAIRLMIGGMFSRVSDRNSLHADKLRNNVDAAMQHLHQPSASHDIAETKVLKKLKALAQFATCHDAVYGFSDRLVLIDDFSFIIDHVVYKRYRLAVSALEMILAAAHVRASDLCWNVIESTTFTVTLGDGSSRKLNLQTQPTCRTVDGRFGALFLHVPSLTHANVLTATVIQCCIGDPQAQFFLVNLFDGSILQVHAPADHSAFMTAAIDARLEECADTSTACFLEAHSAMVQSIARVGHHQHMFDDDALSEISDSDTDADSDTDVETIGESIVLRRELALLLQDADMTA